MTENESMNLTYYIIGFFLGMLFMFIVLRGIFGAFGISGANKILNSPDMRIDTVYTVHKQDTTVTYKFSRNK